MKKLLLLEAYTGASGEKGADWTRQKNSGGFIVLKTTRELYEGEGFTILARWPKGIISRPSGMEY